MTRERQVTASSKNRQTEPPALFTKAVTWTALPVRERWPCPVSCALWRGLLERAWFDAPFSFCEFGPPGFLPPRVSLDSESDVRFHRWAVVCCQDSCKERRDETCVHEQW